jgi:hypothetical protein
MCMEDSRWTLKEQSDRCSLSQCSPAMRPINVEKTHAMDRMEICEKLQMSVNVRARYGESDRTHDPVSDMSARSLEPTHKQQIVDWCCVWCEWRDAFNALSTDVQAVVNECEWTCEHECDVSG